MIQVTSLRRLWGRDADDGAAIVEFLVVVLCLMVPLAYLLAAAVSVHAAAFASTQAVREAGRAFVQAGTPGAGQARAQAAARLAFADQGVEFPENSLAITCDGGACLAPGSAIDVAMTWSVRLPWVPDVVEPERLSIPITARQRIPVDDYRSDQGT